MIERISDGGIRPPRENLVPEGNGTFWDPDTGYIYDAGGVVVARDTVNRPAESSGTITYATDPRLDQMESRVDTMDTQVGWLTHKCENLEERLETV